VNLVPLISFCNCLNDLDDLDSVQEEKSIDIYAPSTSGTEGNDVSKIINEEDCIDPHIVLKKGDFIIVKYETNKQNIMYIGQISIDLREFFETKNKCTRRVIFSFPTSQR